MVTTTHICEACSPHKMFTLLLNLNTQLERSFIIAFMRQFYAVWLLWVMTSYFYFLYPRITYMFGLQMHIYAYRQLQQKFGDLLYNFWAYPQRQFPQCPAVLLTYQQLFSSGCNFHSASIGYLLSIIAWLTQMNLSLSKLTWDGTAFCRHMRFFSHSVELWYGNHASAIPTV